MRSEVSLFNRLLFGVIWGMSNYLSSRGRVGWWHWIRARGYPLGRWGEWVALRWALHLGWDVVARNWTSTRGELDLVAWDGPSLVFAEVKTRREGGLSRPEDAVDEGKREQIERLAMAFRRHFGVEESPIRFDLIAVETPDRREFEIRHYQGFM